MVKALLKNDEQLVLQHNDLNASNVIVRKDSGGAWHVAALLDFERAAVLPKAVQHIEWSDLARHMQVPEEERGLSEFDNTLLAELDIVRGMVHSLMWSSFFVAHWMESTREAAEFVVKSTGTECAQRLVEGVHCEFAELAEHIEKFSMVAKKHNI